MAIEHHPADETLLRYASGNLPARASLVIATHLHFCPECRRMYRGLRSLGGELLRTEEPSPLAPGALATTLARLDETPPAAAKRKFVAAGLPPTLAGQPIAPWRWLAPGIRIAHIGPRDRTGSVFLLRCAPGSSLPAHRHEAPEYSCVIRGGYSDAAGHYSVGDTEESGSDLSHAPKVDPDGECIAVIAVEGKLQLEGWLPRLLQPLFGI